MSVPGNLDTKIELYDIRTGQLWVTLHLPMPADVAGKLMLAAAEMGMGFERDVDRREGDVEDRS